MAFESENKGNADLVTPEERQKWTTEHDALVSFLKGFVEHFGAEEVYRQAKYLFQDTQEGEQYFKEEREMLKEFLLPELLPQINRAQSELQKRATQGGKKRKPPEYDEAKKLLGG